MAVTNRSSKNKMTEKQEYIGIFGGKTRSISLLLLWTGIIGGILLRSVLILSRINSLWASIAWYASMVLFIYFYGYRIYIEDKRQKLIIQYNLSEKLKKEKLSKEDIKQLSTIIDSVAASKVKWNHFFFFIMSVIFLIIQAIIDLLKVA